MDHKLAKKKTHYQSHIDSIVEECGFLECIGNVEESECHLDVDRILSEPNFNSKRKNNFVAHNHSNNVNVQHQIGNNFYPHNNKYEREKFTNDQYRRQEKQSILGTLLHSIFA